MRSHSRRITVAGAVIGLLLIPLTSGAAASGVRTLSQQAAGTYGLLGNAAGPMSRADAPCGGTLIRKSTGGYWICTFSDEFNGSALDATKWSPVLTSQYGYHSGDECMVDSPNNIAVGGGVLTLTARREADPFTCSDPYGDYTTQYTSASVATAGHFSQTYGRFAVRAKFPAATVAGLQSSLWLYPDQASYGAWPVSGEIDIAEFYSAYPDRAIPYVHYVYDPATVVPATNTNVVTNNFCTISNASAFHEYVVEWTPQSIVVRFDGKTCLTDNWLPSTLVKPQPFDQPFFVNLTQALGIGANAFDPATTPLPAVTQVDYVRVWN